jgi:hypothetical protein
MSATRPLLVLLFGAAAPAWAQSSASSLNLELSGATISTQTNAVAEPKASPAPAPSTLSATPNAASLPQAYDTTYGDRRDAAEKACDDKTYGQAQVHGSVGVGVATAKRASASYQTAELNVSKALGSCDDPKGNISATIRVTKSDVNFRRHNRP